MEIRIIASVSDHKRRSFDRNTNYEHKAGLHMISNASSVYISVSDWTISRFKASIQGAFRYDFSEIIENAQHMRCQQNLF